MTDFMRFLVDMKGYDIIYKGRDIPYWSAYLSGHTAKEIKINKTKYKAIPAKALPSVPNHLA